MAKKPIYWVQGKPGSGKSTLMKFAMRDSRTTEFLANCSTGKWIFAAFFFHDRGSNVQKSLTGMMQEILHSILSQLPALVAFVIPLYRNLVQSQQKNRPQWELSVLKAAFLAIIQQRQVRMQLCLFLDALDEHDRRDEDNDHLAKFLMGLARETTGGNIRLKFCLASRPWTVFREHFSECPGFAIHEHTAPDICAYTESRLSLDQRVLQHFLNKNQLITIRELITDQALGVFIWVRLVVDFLTTAVRDGMSFSDLEDEIKKIPRELEELYTHTLRRIDSDYCAEACIMLRTIFCSLEPLPLYTLMRLTHHNIYQLKGIPENDVSTDSLKTQLLRLESRCGGLLEAVFKPNEDVPSRGVEKHVSQAYFVQFIHQTAKEYVQKHQNRLELVNISPLMQGQSGYVYHLNWANTDEASASTIDLLTYAKLYEETLDTSNEKEVKSAFQLLARTARAFFEKGHFKAWNADNFSSLDYQLRSQLSEDDDRRRSYVFAVAANLNLYIGSLGPITTADAEKTPFLLHMAAASVPDNVLYIVPGNLDHSRMVENLVSLGFPVDMNFRMDNDCLTEFGGAPFSNSSVVTPLTQVLLSKSYSKYSDKIRLMIARTLLEKGADPNASFRVRFPRIIFRLSLLEYSLRFESACFVRLLLQYGGKMPTGTMAGALELAHTRRDQEIVQVLKDHGVAVEPNMAAFALFAALAQVNPCITAPSGIPAHNDPYLLAPRVIVGPRGLA